MPMRHFTEYAGISALDFREHDRAAAGIESVDADQRRMADGLGIVLKYMHVAPHCRRLLALKG